MVDVKEIISYIISLKKGFDKDLFHNKIDALAYTVDTARVEYNDFHTLFKVWLNLSIPITKWIHLGVCLVPQDTVEDRTVEYALSWLLSKYGDQSSFSRICFVLDWFTAAMDCNCIDMDKLDLGYDVFYVSLTYETLTPHAIKLVYTLTKSTDVNRRRVLELLDYAKKREAKKNMYRQLQVLLGLFKSYRPECVPEDIPSISIHTAFKKINEALVARFKRSQERRNTLSKEKIYLTWTNPINSGRGKNTKADLLVPNLEFFNIGSRQRVDKEPQKNFLDYNDPVSVIQCGAKMWWSSRPARLRAMLCNTPGVALLAIAPIHHQAFLSHDLHHLLNTCFLDISPHTYIEKQDLLHRLAVLQNTLMQGIPVITRFLAQYLLLWNEKDYFAEIMELVQWVSIDSQDHVMYVVELLIRIYHRAQPLEQCAILNSLNSMYSNLMYCSTRKRQHFLDATSPESYAQVLPLVAAAITQMCNKQLQANPDDMQVLHSTVSSVERRARSSVRYSAAGGVEPISLLSLALPLISVSASLVDSLASIMILYRKMFSILKTLKKLQKDDAQFSGQMQILQAFTHDLINCLYTEEALSSRKSGFVFERLHPQLVSKLGSLMPDIDTKLSIRNSIAFSPYTYIQLGTVDHRDADNKLWFNAVIDQEFTNLSRFLKKAVHELRYQ